MECERETMTEEQMRKLEDQRVDELIARQFRNGDEEKGSQIEAKRPDFQLIVYYKGKNLRRIDIITGDDTYGFHPDLVGKALLHYATEHAGDMIDD